MDPFLRFWRAAYAPYEIAGFSGPAFRIPSFSSPLTSPIFWDGKTPVPADVPHLNLLGEGGPPPGFRRALQFYLGSATATERKGREGAVLPLAKALALPGYWKLLEESFSTDALFLKGFLPFLTTLPAKFQTILLGAEEEPIAAITLGSAGGVGLCLNAAVARERRGEGWSRVLIDECHSLGQRENLSELVFWTEHSFLLPHAKTVLPYQVFVRAN